MHRTLLATLTLCSLVALALFVAQLGATAVAGHRIVANLAALPPGGSLVPIYDLTLHIMAGLLCLGFALAVAVRPLRR